MFGIFFVLFCFLSLIVYLFGLLVFCRGTNGVLSFPHLCIWVTSEFYTLVCCHDYTVNLSPLGLGLPWAILTRPVLVVVNSFSICFSGKDYFSIYEDFLLALLLGDSFILFFFQYCFYIIPFSPGLWNFCWEVHCYFDKDFKK